VLLQNAPCKALLRIGSTRTLYACAQAHTHARTHTLRMLPRSGSNKSMHAKKEEHSRARLHPCPPPPPAGVPRCLSLGLQAALPPPSFMCDAPDLGVTRVVLQVSGCSSGYHGHAKCNVSTSSCWGRLSLHA